MTNRTITIEETCSCEAVFTYTESADDGYALRLDPRDGKSDDDLYQYAWQRALAEFRKEHALHFYAVWDDDNGDDDDDEMLDEEPDDEVPRCPSCHMSWDANVDCDQVGHVLGKVDA